MKTNQSLGVCGRMTKKINVVGVIIIRNNQVLGAQRGEGRALSYLWEFPGGKIEKDETPHQALKRELQEELLIEVDMFQEIFDVTEYEYDFGTVSLTTIICYLEQSDEPTLTEHIAIKWLSQAELKTLDWAPADIPAVNKLMTLTSLERN